MKGNRVVNLRRSFFAVIGISWLLLTAFLAAAAGDQEKKTEERQIPGSAHWPHETSDLAPDPVIRFGRLENGFRYLLMNNREPKDRVSMHLNIQVGSAHESDQELGLAHFLEHMLFNGSTHFKPGELVKYFQKIGMQFGPDANAHTSYFETVYDILLPKGNQESLKEALLVFRDYAEGALLLESEIERERQVVLSEKRERDSSSYRTSVATMGFELEGTILPKRLPIGEEDALKGIDRARMKDFYDAWYRPDKMILVMIGDFDVESAKSLIEERFSGLKARAPRRAEPIIGDTHHHGIKTFYHYEKEAGSATASIQVIRKIEKKPDTFAEQKKRLIEAIADRIVQDRFDTLISSGSAPFSSAAIGSGIYMQQIEYAELAADSNPQKWEQALSTLEQTLRRALIHGFTLEELIRVKKDILSDMENAVREEATRNSRNLAHQIIGHLNSNRVFQSPMQEKEQFAKVVESLEPEEVHAAFREAWSPSHRLILLTGNAGLKNRDISPEDRLRGIYEKSLARMVQKPIVSKAPRFPYLAAPKHPGAVAKRTDIEDLGVVQVDFANGIRLNLKKTDFTDNEVLANLIFGFGRSAEPKAYPGLGVLAEDLIKESGMGRLKKDEIERALAGKSTRVTFHVAENRFEFEGNSVSDEIELLFQLMYAHLLDPAYREEAYRLVMERFKNEYEELDHSIDGAMRLFGNGFLAGYDGRFGLPRFDVFKRLTLSQVQTWTGRYFKEAEIEISVVGDFDVKQTIETASRYFGSLPPRKGPKHPIGSDTILFPTGKSISMDVTTRIPKGLAVIAYRTEDLWDIQRTRRLNILGEVASERLREKIRETMGASYSPFAYNRPSRAYTGYGLFLAMANADPNLIDRVIAEIKKTLSEIADTGISGDELQRAIEPVRTSIKDMMRRNSYWLDTVLSGSKDHPQQLDWSREVLEDYASITETEVSSLAKRYLNENRAATLSIKPKPFSP
ncbi:MAG: insulinase family protein [Pseudomonadota bacterium]